MTDELAKRMTERVYRPALAKILEEAGYDPAGADQAEFVRVGPVNPAVDVSFDLSGELPVMNFRVSSGSGLGLRWLALVGSADPRRRKRGWRMFSAAMRANLEKEKGNR